MDSVGVRHHAILSQFVAIFRPVYDSGILSGLNRLLLQPSLLLHTASSDAKRQSRRYSSRTWIRSWFPHIFQVCIMCSTGVQTRDWLARRTPSVGPSMKYLSLDKLHDRLRCRFPHDDCECPKCMAHVSTSGRWQGRPLRPSKPSYTFAPPMVDEHAAESESTRALRPKTAGLRLHESVAAMSYAVPEYLSSASAEADARVYKLTEGSPRCARAEIGSERMTGEGRAV